MYKRCLYTIILGAMLAMAANLMPASYAQAMGTECRCPTGECSCSCCRQLEAQVSPAVLQFPNTPASGSCTCSTGPNPFRADESKAAAYVDPPKKRFFQPLTTTVSVVYSAPIGLPVKKYKPPAASCQRLYLLNSSFRI